jgi:CBS domain-containing protein
LVLYARDIVETDCLVFPRDTTVVKAAEEMKQKRHGYALIGSIARPEGMVTEWDILEKIVASRRDPEKTSLREIMSTDLVSIEADESIATVATVMTERGVRRMLVTNKGEVIGVITAKTVLAKLDDYINKISSQISRLQAPWV